MSDIEENVINVHVYSPDKLLRGELDNLNEVSLSFLLNKTGMCTLHIPVNHPKATVTLLEEGNIVVVYSSHLGTWSGYILKREWSNDGDMIIVTCYSVENRLDGRLTEPIRYKNVHAGDIFRRLIEGANRVASTGITVGDVFLGGDKIEFQVGAQKVYQTLLDLLDKSGLEIRTLMLEPGHWELSLYEAAGSDLTDSVVVIVGQDTSGRPGYSEDWTKYASSILAVGKQPDEGGDGGGNFHTSAPGGGGGGNAEDDGWAKRPKVRYTDEWSVGHNKLGFVEDMIEESEIGDRAGLMKAAQKEVNKRKYPVRTLSFNLTNDRGLWGLFEEGDIICVQLPDYAFTGLAVPYKVLGREFSADRQLLAVAGEIVEGEKAQNLSMFDRAHYGSGGGEVPTTADFVNDLEQYL